MIIECHDVPLLMRKGFHWTISNVKKENGFVTGLSKDVRSMELISKYTNTRWWLLKDSKQPMEWVASIRVHGTLESVTNIRLQDWFPTMVLNAEAVNNSGNQIYFFDREQPHKAFNAIYDDMPLEGWWPWPKKN